MQRCFKRWCCYIFTGLSGNEPRYLSASRSQPAVYDRYSTENRAAADLVASKFTLPAVSQPLAPPSDQRLAQIGYRLGESYAAKQAQTSHHAQRAFGGESTFDQLDAPDMLVPPR